MAADKREKDGLRYGYIKQAVKNTVKGPTQRTLEYLRSLGATAKVVEKWNQWAGVRQDLWGADILACRLHRFDNRGVAIQCTSASNHSARVKKALANPDVRLWLDMGVGFRVYSWGKHVVKKKPTWDKVPRVTSIYINGGDGLVAMDD